MKGKLSDEQNKEILKTLNHTIENGVWEKSNFLKMIGKNLIKLRDEFSNKIGLGGQINSKKDHNAKIGLGSNYQEIFISLYSSTGSNFQSWEKIVQNLPKQLISRPIYGNEEDLKSVLRLKTNKHNEAYVAIYVDKKDILTLAADKASLDRLGVPLLSLKNKSLALENISRFVHSSGTYIYDNGRLVRN